MADDYIPWWTNPSSGHPQSIIRPDVPEEAQIQAANEPEPIVDPVPDPLNVPVEVTGPPAIPFTSTADAPLPAPEAVPLEPTETAQGALLIDPALLS